MRLFEIHGNRWINPERVVAVYLARSRVYADRKHTLIPCVRIATTAYQEMDGEGSGEFFDRLISENEDPQEALREVVSLVTDKDADNWRE